MYLLTGNKIECCGCGNCTQICPKQCITMVFSEDGFAYPKVETTKCVHCNRCIQFCPFDRAEQTAKAEQNQICYYGWHRNPNIRYESTSGGAFSAIAELILEKNGIIYGAMYDDTLKVCHGRVTKTNDLGKLRQSKYVQSEIGDCFKIIEKELQKNKKILFCGTPCQIHSLRTFLNEDYQNLLLVDFVCHGVTSPQIFNVYLNSLVKKHGSRIRKIRFRDKITIGNFSSVAFTTIEFENNKKISSEINCYLIAYMHGLMQRESCEACPYATIYRYSDLTIADFWGIENFVKNISEESDKGISLILANSHKGKVIGTKLMKKMHLQQIDVSAALNGKNQQLTCPVKKNQMKTQFCRDSQIMPMELALLKNIGLSNYMNIVTNMVKNRIKIFMPKSGRKIIGKFVRQRKR